MHTFLHILQLRLFRLLLLKKRDRKMSSFSSIFSYYNNFEYLKRSFENIRSQYFEYIQYLFMYNAHVCMHAHACMYNAYV